VSVCVRLQASLAVTVDPVDRAMRVRAAAVFPGPEWRDDVYNEDTRRLELVQVGRGGARDRGRGAVELLCR